MATCAAVGQGVGTAAALALRCGVAPGAIAADPGLLRAIQQRLLRDDAYLLGVARADPEDLAPRARVTASSAQPGGEAHLVLSAQTRAVEGPPAPASGATANQWESVLRELATGKSTALYTAAPPGRSAPGLHRWMSAPAAGLPASLELRWPAPVRLREVQLIFDTGLHRFLTLSQADGYTARMEWGRPQPETVRDYQIEAEIAGEWARLEQVAGNYQRRRVHRLAGEGVTAAALRIVVTATNGLDHARICEVRAYG